MNWSKIGQIGRALGILVAICLVGYLCYMWVKTTEQGPCTYYPHPCHTHPAGH